MNPNNSKFKILTFNGHIVTLTVILMNGHNINCMIMLYICENDVPKLS